VRKRLFVVKRDHQVLYPSFLCDIPLVRGDSGGCVEIPLSEEVDCGCLALCLSLICEVDFVLALCLASKRRGYICWREELCTPNLYLPKSSVEAPCVRSPVWTS